MKTDKIKTVVEVKEHTNSYGTTYYHNLEMENGDKINIGKKETLTVGQEIEYEITGDEQHEYRKAKRPFNQPNQSAAPNPDNLKGIKIGHAINNAVILIGSEGKPEGMNLKEAIKENAKMIYQISEELNTEI